MAKKLKGKQKEHGKQQHPEALAPSPLGKLPTIPEQITTLPKLNTNVHGGHSVASGSHPADTWGATAQEEEPRYISGAWAHRDDEEEVDEDEDEREDDGGWGETAQRDDQWGGGGSGTAAHASPAIGASPAGGAWGQQLPAQGGGWAVPNLVSAITNAFGSGGGHTDGGMPGPQKSTPKQAPPTFPTPPGAKHVAFGMTTHLPPGAALQAPGHKAQHSSPQQASRSMHGRSQGHAGFPGGWDAPEKPMADFGAFNQSPGDAWARPQQPARIQTNFPAAPTQSRAATLPTGAWTKWGREAQSLGMPKVATTIAASVPTAHPPPPQHQVQPAAAAAAAVVAPAHAAFQQAMAQRQAQLQEMLSHPGLAQGAAQAHLHPGLRRRQASAPAAAEHAPVWQQPKQSWQDWATTHQEQAAVRGHAKPQRPQQIQMSESWGSSEWTDVGRGRGHGGRRGGSENGASDGGWENKEDGGGWSEEGAGGGWGDGGGGAGAGWGAGGEHYGGEDAAWAKPVGGKREKERERGHGRSKSEHHDDGWGQADRGGWGDGNHGKSSREHKAHKTNAGWGQTQADAGWGSPKGDAGRTQATQAWGSSSRGRGGWGAIAEEDEEEETYNDEDEDEGDEDYDDLEDMYLDPREGDRKRKTNSGISYQYQSPAERPAPMLPPGGMSVDQPLTTFASFSPMNPHAPSGPNPDHSRTMNIAVGRMNTVFELSPPRRGLGENTFVDSRGATIMAAQNAFYNSKRRPARDRVYWGFNPDKDERVQSLLGWIQAMSNGLATVGVQRFLQTGQRGALFASAGYQVEVTPGAPKQPAFDWLTLEQIRPTMDRILQESVVCYKPMSQVVVFVFLLSKSGSSMAVWRRKLLVPESLRMANKDALEHTIAALPEERIVYVDEVLLEPGEPPPPPPKKKRGFWRRLFGFFKRKPKAK